MLPPRMREIKSRLEEKSLRSNAEEELLDELRLIDNRIEKSDITHAEKQFSGPSGRCPCCGR